MYGALAITLTEEKLLIGSDLKSIRFTCCKKYNVRKKILTYGLPNGGTKAFSALFPAAKMALAFFLITTSIFKLWKPISMIQGALSCVT